MVRTELGAIEFVHRRLGGSSERADGLPETDSAVDLLSAFFRREVITTAVLAMSTAAFGWAGQREQAADVPVLGLLQLSELPVDIVPQDCPGRAKVIETRPVLPCRLQVACRLGPTAL